VTDQGLDLPRALAAGVCCCAYACALAPPPLTLVWVWGSRPPQRDGAVELPTLLRSVCSFAKRVESRFQVLLLCGTWSWRRRRCLRARHSERRRRGPQGQACLQRCPDGLMVALVDLSRERREEEVGRWCGDHVATQRPCRKAAAASLRGSLEVVAARRQPRLRCACCAN